MRDRLNHAAADAGEDCGAYLRGVLQRHFNRLDRPKKTSLK